MAIAITGRTRQSKITIEADVTDMDPIAVMFGKIQFLPDSIVVSYDSTDGGPWKIHAFVVRGNRILKSGETSEMAHANDYGYTWFPAAPQWARDFATANTPNELS